MEFELPIICNPTATLASIQTRRIWKSCIIGAGIVGRKIAKIMLGFALGAKVFVWGIS